MNYHRINDEDLRFLSAIVDEDRIFAGDAVSSDYSRDEFGGIDGVQRLPEVLLRVKSEEEISEIMKYASLKNIPVVARGSGTGLVGAAVSIYGGIMLETTLMNKILELDEENMTVTVEPGVLLMDLAKYVEEHDLFYPPDPGEKAATIGGNISTNAGGMRAVKYGVTRDYVRGLTAVLPDGSLIETGGKVVKNSTGYAIKDLLVGSEGTLGIITKAILRVVPLPKFSVSLLCPFENMNKALETVPAIIRAKHVPTAIEFMDRATILLAEDFLGKRFPSTDSPAYLLLTIDGSSPGYIEEEYTALARLCLDCGAKDVYIADTEERKNSVWSARAAFLGGIEASTTEWDECDVVVPRSEVSGFIRFTLALSDELDIRICYFGHAGDGNVHIDICRDSMDDATWDEKLHAAFDRLYAKAAEIGGLISGEHGIGYAKKPYLLRRYGEGQIDLMRRIKAAFDPQNILNPGKIF